MSACVSIPNAFRSAVQAYSETPLVVTPDAQYSFAQIDVASDAIAAALAVFHERVRGRGDRERHDELTTGHCYSSPSSSASIASRVRFS